ncbi:hypothetical protein ABIE26_000870 [Pedobacter africanus]|uniref:Uncharacterized protein n=1 Tax=Pedobacter africanus TaxID=151894 RepID=A0ACC6KTY5_9SPHI|nr:hypothetical protein [Pedobacter africanus]MDR6782642.1 hypothetical protein [Pedobacter africanus]
MKTIHHISTLLFVSVILILGSNTKAQEFKTGESIKAQLLQGTTPGLKLGPVVQKKQSEDNSKELQYTSGNFKAYLQKAAQGSGAGGAGTQSRSIAPSANKAKTGSSQMPSDGKTPEPEQKKTEAPKLPPMQTEQKGTVPL